MALVRVARTSEVPQGKVVVVQVEDDEIALCNVNGEIYAIANLCTHDNGPLNAGYLYGEEIECPRHGARFNVRTGEVKVLPAIMPLPTYEVQVQGEDILVDVD